MSPTPKKRNANDDSSVSYGHETPNKKNPKSTKALDDLKLHSEALKYQLNTVDQLVRELRGKSLTGPSMRAFLQRIQDMNDARDALAGVFDDSLSHTQTKYQQAITDFETNAGTAAAQLQATVDVDDDLSWDDDDDLSWDDEPDNANGNEHRDKSQREPDRQTSDKKNDLSKSQPKKSNTLVEKIKNCCKAIVDCVKAIVTAAKRLVSFIFSPITNSLFKSSKVAPAPAVVGKADKRNLYNEDASPSLSLRGKK
jgi:hypothetical protein